MDPGYEVGSNELLAVARWDCLRYGTSACAGLPKRLVELRYQPDVCLDNAGLAIGK